MITPTNKTFFSLVFTTSRAFSTTRAVGLAPSRLQSLATRVQTPQQKEVAEKKKLLTAERKQLAADKKKVATLKTKLTKEKATYATLKKKYEVASKKQKEKLKEQVLKEKARFAAQKSKSKKALVDAKQKEEKFIAKATKPFRKLSGYNYFIKETTVGKKGLGEVSNVWKSLTETEKESYQHKATKYNEDMLKIFVPKPKSPPTSYAAYVKENYSSDGRDFKEINKELAAGWKNLPASEKHKYEPTKNSKEDYQTKLKQWKEQRIEAFKKHNNIS